MDRGYMPPAPKRSTLESQKRQYKKLVTPFRSPLTPKAIERCATVGTESRSKPVQKVKEPITSSTCKEEPSSDVEQHRKAKIRTPRASAQFKSPVVHSNAFVSKDRASIRLTPTVLTLEHKLQLLRRAVKVKEDDEEKVLEGLVKKWTAAGREAAYELWDLVKDVSELQNKPSDLTSLWNSKDDTNWGWDKSADDEEGGRQEGCIDDTMDCEEDKPRHTMGTMLRQLRIDPETLGWDDEIESFCD